MSMQKKGLFCVFEGIDGAGKTTLIQCLAEKILLTYGSPNEAMILKEPSTLPTGQKIRRLLQEKALLKPQEWLELFIADRRQNLKENVAPAHAAGKIILQDRYFYSTAAYQAVPGEKGLRPQDIVQRNVREGFRKPDLLFFLALSPDTAYQRIQKRALKKESFEEKRHLQTVALQYEHILPGNTIRLDAALDSAALCEKAFAAAAFAV